MSTFAYTYNNSGALTALRHINENGDSQQRDLALDDNLTKQFVVDGEQVLDITYSNTGNPTTVVYSGKTVNYEYDALNRLVKVDEGGEITLDYQYKAGENDIRIQLDDRTPSTPAPTKRTSPSELGVNALYTRSTGTAWQHVTWNEALGQIQLAGDKGYIAADATALIWENVDCEPSYAFNIDGTYIYVTNSVGKLNYDFPPGNYTVGVTAVCAYCPYASIAFDTVDLCATPTSELDYDTLQNACPNRAQNKKLHEFDGCTFSPDDLESYDNLSLTNFDKYVVNPVWGKVISNGDPVSDSIAAAQTLACNLHDRDWQTCSRQFKKHPLANDNRLNTMAQIFTG